MEHKENIISTNVIFPAAGLGTRFQGYSDPKPFIIINGKCIIEWALSSFGISGKYYVIVRKFERKYLDRLEKIYSDYNLNAQTIILKEETSGGAETCLKIQKHINLNEQLFIVNPDHYTPWNYKKFQEFAAQNWDVVVTTYPYKDVVLNKPGRYSYILTDKEDKAVEFREKFAISKNALNGIHYWKKAEYFFNSAKKLLKNKTSDERYLSHTFKYLIREKYRISYYQMQKNEFVSLGSPEEIAKNLHRIPT